MVSLDPGGAVKAVADGFRHNPACLAAVVLAVIYGMLSYWSTQRDDERQHERLTKLMDSCFERLPRLHGPPD